VAAIGILAAAAALNPLCLRLAPVALGIVFFYSFTKRFTSFSHLVLGFSLGIAPAAAWIAVRGELSAPALWLVVAVTTWIGGFDILYALSDREFDRSAGIIPSRRASVSQPRWQSPPPCTSAPCLPSSLWANRPGWGPSTS